MSSDPLIFLPESHWHKLKKIMKLDWPSILGHIILDTQEYITKKGQNYGFKVYCPFGKVSNGMVAINTKNTHREIIIHYPKDDTSILEKALRNTKVIDWNKTFEVCWSPEYVVKCVKRVMAEKGIEEISTMTTKTFVLNKHIPFDVKLPLGFSFKPLTMDNNIELIDFVWPHRYPSSVWYFELLTKANLGYGLFNNKELVSWVFMNEIGTPGHIYTLEKHRRKGYGEITIKLISNVLMSQGNPVIAFTVPNNTKMNNLLEKIGFEHVNYIENHTFRKRNNAG